MKATCTAPKGTMMVLHSASLHAVIIDPLWDRSGGNWRSLWKRNPARSASGKPLSCKFLEAGKVFWLSITKCLFLVCINSQASPRVTVKTNRAELILQKLVRPILWYSVPELTAFTWWKECVSLLTKYGYGVSEEEGLLDLLMGLLWQPSCTYAIAFVKIKFLIQH